MQQVVIVQTGTLNQSHQIFIEGMRAYRAKHQLDWLIRLPVPTDGEHTPDQAYWVIPNTDMLDQVPNSIQTDSVCALFGQANGGIESCIRMNQQAFGHIAARHYWELGYRQLIVLPTASASLEIQQRVQGFLDGSANLGIHCLEFLRPDSLDSIELIEWLENCPHPAGIYCPTDGEARWIRQLLADSRLSVPRDLAIIGTGNQEAKCLEREPFLTSIAYPWRVIGETAALWLHKAINNSEDKTQKILRPYHIIERATTPIIPIELPSIVKKAQAWMRKNLKAKRPLTECASSVNVSIATLCRHFNKSLGMTPQKYHERLRIDLACKLLRTTEWSIKVIARECGYATHTKLGVAFKRRFSCSPTEWRRSLEQ